MVFFAGQALSRREESVRVPEIRRRAAAKIWPGDGLPVMVCIIDDAEKIQRFLPTPESMVYEGLIGISDVEVNRYRHCEASPATA